MVVPAAPALVDIKNNPVYYKALLNSDFAIPDSGFMVLVLKYLKGIKLKKLSGVEFLRKFIENTNKSEKLFLVDPTVTIRDINNKYLNNNSFNIPLDCHYVAPIYDKSKIIDPVLIKIIERKNPKFVLINLGGGVQEPLGFYLKENLSFKPAIICTGGALEILNGQQVAMPRWVDKIYLGWLARCINNPKRFIPRYLKGFKLLPMLMNEKIEEIIK